MAEPTQKTIAIDPVTDDLQFPIVLITGRAAFAQRLRNRFRFFLGEWFLDRRQGVPYFQRVLGVRPYNERVVRALMLNVIESTPGCQRVIKAKLVFNLQTRTLTIDDLEIVTTDGQVFRSQPNEFVLALVE